MEHKQMLRGTETQHAKNALKERTLHHENGDQSKGNYAYSPEMPTSFLARTDRGRRSDSGMLRKSAAKSNDSSSGSEAQFELSLGRS
jgi:hypothetical protein